MPYGLYISAEGANVQSRRMEVLANNLANVDTPGFKRDLALFRARYAEETQRGDDRPGSRSVNDLGGGVWFDRSVTVHEQGPLKRTAQPTDIAIEGDGFFVVEKEGKEHLTRAGNFALNNEGLLVTQAGEPVLSDEGDPITVVPELPWRVSPDGAIEQAGTKTFLALVNVRQPGDLVKVGDNFFRALGPTAPLPPEVRRVREGHLEMSGVRPTLAMLELIETSRAFETNVTMIKNHDSMLNSLVNRVLKSA